MFLYHTLMEVQSEAEWRDSESRCRTRAMHRKPNKNACMLYHESCADQLDSWNSTMHKDQSCTAQKCGSRRRSGRLDLIDGLPEGHTSHSYRRNGWT